MLQHRQLMPCSCQGWGTGNQNYAPGWGTGGECTCALCSHRHGIKPTHSVVPMSALLQWQQPLFTVTGSVSSLCFSHSTEHYLQDEEKASLCLQLSGRLPGGMIRCIATDKKKIESL